jgi:hypothetical protein
MRSKYFGEDQAFEFVWKNCDADGLWNGNAETLARKFNVSADEAYETLGALCDRGLIEKLVPGKYAVVKWHEGDDPGEEEEPY